MIYQQRVPSSADEREKAYAFEYAKQKFSGMIYDFLIQHKPGVVEIESNIRREVVPDEYSWYKTFDVIEFRLDYIEVAYKNVTFPVFQDYYSFHIPPPTKNIFQRIISFLRSKMK